MLDFIRRNAGSWVIKFILGAIALVFVLWGIGTFRSERLDILAEVDGEEILVQEYREAYSNAIERYRQMFGGQLPEGMLERLNLKQQVLESLINDTLIRQASEEMGLIVSDEEVQQTVLSIPALNVNGTFDMAAYQRALRSAHLSPAGFEARVRQELLMDKMQAFLAGGLTVPEREAMDHYLFENEQINLAFVGLQASECEPQVQVVEADLEAWYEGRKEGYKTEPEVNVRYLAFRQADMEKDVKFTEADVQTYYDENQERYMVKERRQARHILLRVDKDADKETEAKVRAKAASLLERIKKGEDFSGLAAQFSEDPGSAKQGGDLGFFGRGAMVPDFEKAAFALKEGEVSDLVRSRFGWHIIKLEKIEGERVRPLTEVKDAVAVEVRKKMADDLAMARAKAAYDEIIQAGGLDTYAKRKEIRLEETGLFSEKKPPAVLGPAPETLRQVLVLEKGELSSLLRGTGCILVAEMLDKKASYVPPLAEVQARARKDYVREKAQGLCKGRAEALLKSARLGDLAVVAKAQGLEVQETGLFKRTDRTAQGKLPANVVQAGLALHKGKPYPDEVVEGGGKVFVLAYAGQRDADTAGFEAGKGALVQRILSEKQQVVFKDWLGALRAKARVKMVQEI